MTEIVVIFDFDRTLIDGDSDNWVITEMGVKDLYKQLRSTLPWNRLMDRMMEELHSQGKSIEDIGNCLKKVPLDSRVIAAIKSAHAIGCDLKIVSDANEFFIEKILDCHGLLRYFSEIYTNPTFVDEEGRLRIFPYHNSTMSPHGCSLCPPNLCKGLVLDHILTSNLENKKSRIIYLGDGGGDFCPTLKLQKGDFVMPRKDFPLWHRISDNIAVIKAGVHEWGNGKELGETLLRLIDTISMVESTKTSDS